MSVVVTRREMVAWALAIMLAVSMIVMVRPDGADAGGGGPTTDVVFIATGENFPDALGAGPVAALGIGPILLVNQNSVPQATLDELNRLKPSQVFIVGGPAVVSEGVKSTLEGLGFSPTVERLSGADRFETAAEVSAATFPTAQVVAAHAGGEQAEEVVVDEVVRSVTLTAPSSGVVVVNSTATALEDTAGDQVLCSITTGDAAELDFAQGWESPGDPATVSQVAGTRGFDVDAGEFTANLVCLHLGLGSSEIRDSALTAIFVPSS